MNVFNKGSVLFSSKILLVTDMPSIWGMLVYISSNTYMLLSNCYMQFSFVPGSHSDLLLL